MNDTDLNMNFFHGEELPSTPAGRLEMIEAMLSHVDDEGNPAPLITPEQGRELLNGT